MSKWTDQLPEAAKEYIGSRRVDEVECVTGDIAGVARGKAMPATKFDTGPDMCLSKILFQQECYGCGMTRACMRLAHGQIEEAGRFNKLAYLVFPLLCMVYGAEVLNLSARLGLPIPPRVVKALRKLKL
jgi:ABC-type proline/glycine betaine transport system substrate-binding protein